jgi:hypothetical protein
MPRGRNYVTKDLFASVIKAYLESPKFNSLAELTQKSYRRLLRIAEHPDCLGSVPIDTMRPALVQAFLDGLADRPGVQQNAQTALKALEKWAVVRDLLPRQITLGTEVIGCEGGHVPWTDEQVAFAEANTAAHLSRAITLAANTGQRGSDTTRMRWADIEVVGGRPGINVTQKKTKLQIWVPFTHELIAKMETWERRPGFILLKADGTPFTERQHLTDAWIRELRRPELRPLSDLVLHGLRGTAVVRLRRAGATVPEISSMVGMSPPMVERYCRFSVQRENALAAVNRLDASKPSVNILKFPKA